MNTGSKYGLGGSLMESMTGLFTKIDIFGSDTPKFRLGGRDYLPTFFGGAITAMMFVVIGLYTLIKLEQLFSRSNPNISFYTEA